MQLSKHNKLPRSNIKYTLYVISIRLNYSFPLCLWTLVFLPCDFIYLFYRLSLSLLPVVLIPYALNLYINARYPKAVVNPQLTPS